MTSKPSKSRTSKLGNLLFMGVIAITALYVVRSLIVSPAPIPDLFHDQLTLTQAVDRSADKDGVVLAVVTADWCGPCQRYKRGGLTDQRVAEWIDKHGEPVYINLDKNRDLAYELGVSSVPTTIFIHNGEPLGAVSGPMSGKSLLAFLDRGLARATDAHASAN